MIVEINLPNSLCKHLSDSGKITLTNIAIKHMCDILAESSRLESIRNTSSSVPEITGPIIKDSETYIVRYPTTKKPTWWNIGLYIVSYISTLFAGWLFDISKFTDPIILLAFLFSSFLAISTTMAVYFIGAKND